MKKYLYEVRPVKPVHTPEGRSTRCPFSVLLSKEEVIGYMRSCTIYRRFPDIAPIRVTGSNLDDLHRERYVKETSLVEPKLEEKPKADNFVKFDEENPNTEEPVEEVIEEENKQEEISVEEVAPINDSVEVTEELVEEVINEEESLEDNVEETVNEPVESVEEVKSETKEKEVSEDIVEESVEVQEEIKEEVKIEEVVSQITQNSTPQNNTKNIQVNHNKNNYHKHGKK